MAIYSKNVLYEGKIKENLRFYVKCDIIKSDQRFIIIYERKAHFGGRRYDSMKNENIERFAESIALEIIDMFRRESDEADEKEMESAEETRDSWL